MFQSSKNKKQNKSTLDKNLRMMSLSAIVLIALFIYTIFKSENIIHGSSYYFGIGFLFILLILTFSLQKYKDKIRSMIPKNKFQLELESANTNSLNDDSYEEIEEDTSNNIEVSKTTITFNDVAGIKDVKEELEEIVDFLNHPKKYQQYGVSLPNGVLLVGPPGVGKTLIAKAVAGEADVPFFYQSGASFVHIYVGMGAKRVRELFTKAKAKAPSIIFIDEIDAIGKSRGVGGNDEREATLNELLTQMDGFDSSSGVMVIAATNKIEVLDEALLRAGRFDRRVFITKPSKEDRVDILNLYLKNKHYNFNIEKLAYDTSGFSSAALATLVNESLLYMIKNKRNEINENDIEYAKQKIQFGKNQLHILTEEQKDILSTYQAGKAYIMQSNVHLFDRGIVEEDLIYPSKNQLENQIKKYLAGTVTLEVIKKESYIVFEDEFKQAYEIARKMVEVYKMETNIDDLIGRIKYELSITIGKEINKINQIKKVLLKDEVVVF